MTATATPSPARAPPRRPPARRPARGGAPRRPPRRCPPRGRTPGRMTAMSTTSPAGFPRRRLLAGAAGLALPPARGTPARPARGARRRLLAGAAGLALLAAGCTSGGSDGTAADAPAQDDRLADQVPVQEAVVAAYEAAAAGDPGVGDRRGAPRG